MFKVQPPSEIYEATSVKALALQYQSLSSWLRSVEHMPFGNEIFVLQSLTLCKMHGDETCFQATLKDIRDASRWPPRYIPRVGTHISSLRHGLCVVRDVQKKTDMTRFYKYVMSSSLGEIRARAVWHIVFAWHFCVHASTSSESLAESVGSFLSSLRRQNVSHSLGTKRIAWGAQLKSAGLKGTGGEDGIMAMALNVHFDTQGPEGWHFVSKSSADGGKTSLVHFRSQARLCNQPAWVSSYLTDVVRRRRMVLTKVIRRATHFFLDDAEKRIHDQEGACSKRRRVAELAEQAYEPNRLSDTLWRKLGVTVQSLSHNLRPGTKPR
jgi:hypothetical protein